MAMPPKKIPLATWWSILHADYSYTKLRSTQIHGMGPYKASGDGGAVHAELWLHGP
jgi:hypothetical protein